MTYRHTLALALIFCFFFSTRGQTVSQTTPQQQRPAQTQETEEDVVRITTNLVQVDAVVTDSQGRLVTDLTADDFEIREDNRPQKITNFSFISTESAQPVASTPARSADRTAPPVPTAPLRPEQVRRTFALVVDDLGLSPSSLYYTRKALKKFVDEQMQPGDLIAIVLTSGNLGALQQFTNNKQLLYAAINRLRWNPNARGQGGLNGGVSLDTDPRLLGPNSSDNSQGALQNLENFRNELFTVGTLGALRYIVRGMRDLPGRKAVLLISDGFKIWITHPAPLSLSSPYTGIEPSYSSERILASLRQLTDLANRSSVVIYTMNAAGVQAPDFSGIAMSGGRVNLEDVLSNDRANRFDSQAGLTYIAQQTGGFAVHGTNDLAGGIVRVLDDQKGYYLLGYRPEESTFAPGNQGYKRFHKIIVKVKRPGLHVRSRTGFYGVTDEVAHPAPHTRNEQLIAALDSPFKATGVDVRMTSLFTNDAQAGSFMRSILHINARNLTFTNEPDGTHKSTFDVLAVTFGDNGQILDEIGRSHTITVSDRTYRRIMEHGFDYLITVPLKKPGAYQLRVSLRDSASERLGSASQFIEAPDLTKNRLALSGIVMSGTEPATLKPLRSRLKAKSARVTLKLALPSDNCGKG